MSGWFNGVTPHVMRWGKYAAAITAIMGAYYLVVTVPAAQSLQATERRILRHVDSLYIDERHSRIYDVALIAQRLDMQRQGQADLEDIAREGIFSKREARLMMTRLVTRSDSIHQQMWRAINARPFPPPTPTPNRRRNP